MNNLANWRVNSNKKSSVVLVVSAIMKVNGCINILLRIVCGKCSNMMVFKIYEFRRIVILTFLYI